MIEIKNFEKNYYNFSHKEPVFTVEDVSFTSEKGKITGLLGPNGSGKTTIMKAICGFHYPEKGIINVSDNEGNIFNVLDNPHLAMKYIGYVPEKSILPSEMYVYSFLEYCCELHGLFGNDKKNSISRVIEECSLEKVVSKKIKTLSKGYGQRVSLAQSIIHNPPNLILDEPVTGLDPAQIIQMRKLIKKLAETKTVILSTHILQEVFSLCDNLVIISNGKITAKGTEQEVINKANVRNLEEAFIKLTQSE